jgi:1-acyl-sn-glycerol-3-phosphate acyltransferase
MFDRFRKKLDRSRHEPLIPRYGVGQKIARAVLPRDIQRVAENLRFNDTGHGIDRFGLSAEGAMAALAATRFLYSTYFRVTSHGIENLPAQGRAVMTCNHSGTVPFDALMVCTDIMVQTEGARVARPVMDFFVPSLPFVNKLFSGGGGIRGSRGNFHALLEDEELLLVFPEGVPGIGKPFSERYKLQQWRPGHAELAIRHSAPVVPACVIGAEEQWPQVARIESIHLFDIPYLPIPGTPFPLPVHYHVWYGEPIPIGELYRPEDASDAGAVAEAAQRIKDRTQELIHHGLEQRRGVFR